MAIPREELNHVTVLRKAAGRYALWSVSNSISLPGIGDPAWRLLQFSSLGCTVGHASTRRNPILSFAGYGLDPSNLRRISRRIPREKKLLGAYWGGPNRTHFRPEESPERKNRVSRFARHCHRDVLPGYNTNGASIYRLRRLTLMDACRRPNEATSWCLSSACLRASSFVDHGNRSEVPNTRESTKTGFRTMTTSLRGE